MLGAPEDLLNDTDVNETVDEGLRRLVTELKEEHHNIEHDYIALAVISEISTGMVEGFEEISRVDDTCVLNHDYNLDNPEEYNGLELVREFEKRNPEYYD